MKIENLQIGYTNPLLSLSNLQLEKGKVYALVGANGRGKTTLLKTLIGQISPLSGDVRIDERSISELTSADKSKHFGFVQSRFPGVPFMKAKEYVALGRTPYTNAFGRLRDKDFSIVEESLQIMQIEHLAERFTEELSDGERQLLAITKVLAQETAYIFLDEPTAFLDYANKKKILELLTKIALEQNKCILFSSHDLEMTIHHTNGILFVPKTSNHMKFTSIDGISLKELVYACFEEES